MNLDRTLTFKGRRNYLHSTTVFDDILRLRAGEARSIDFIFDRKVDRQVRYQSGPPADPATLVATWRDAYGTLYVVDRGVPIEDTTPYDEDGLAERFAFAGDTVSLPDVEGNSLIEAVVAGFKALLLRTVAAKGTRLAFVRLRLDHVPALPLEIRFARRIGEFYQGEIRSGDKVVGQIFFGEWR